MPQQFASVEQYIEALPEDRREAVSKLRKEISENLPAGFHEQIGYKMIGYVIPHSTYPNGYHCNKSLPLPFLNIASQKGHIGVYHMGIYADPRLLKWFLLEYEKVVGKKPDMGKSCIRFKKLDEIPYALMGELFSKITPDQWIATYEMNYKR